jgi:hypothetical protein
VQAPIFYYYGDNARIKGVLGNDDSTIGDGTGPIAGGGAPAADQPDLTDAQSVPDEEKTADWAKPLLHVMEPPGMVINEPPLYYVARELASGQPYYDELSQRQRFELICTVQDVLAPDKGGRNFPPGFDFNAARSKLDKLLRKGV